MISDTFLISLIVAFVSSGVAALTTKRCVAYCALAFFAGMLIMDVWVEFRLRQYSHGLPRQTAIADSLHNVKTPDILPVATADANMILKPTWVRIHRGVSILNERVIITYLGETRTQSGCAAMKQSRLTISPTDSGVVDRTVVLGEQVFFSHNGDRFQVNLLEKTIRYVTDEHFTVRISVARIIEKESSPHTSDIRDSRTLTE